jgi:hypothetical protein
MMNDTMSRAPPQKKQRCTVNTGARLPKSNSTAPTCTIQIDQTGNKQSNNNYTKNQTNTYRSQTPKLGTAQNKLHRIK